MKPLEFTHVFVIESLRPGDRETGTELYNDIIVRRRMQKGLEHQCKLFNVTSRMELFAGLEEIRQFTIQGANPIIHLEMHGDEDGLQVTNGENIAWNELAFFLTQINGICGNNLFVTMATCKGGYIFKVINPAFCTPFWGFIGPFEEVDEDEVLANYSAFYDSFLDEADFQKAEAALHAANHPTFSRFRLYSTARIFAKAYENYKTFHLIPERVEERLNEMVVACRPLPEFYNWSDEKIKKWGRTFIVDTEGLLKKDAMRKFFLLDKFPEHSRYYEEI